MIDWLMHFAFGFQVQKPFKMAWFSSKWFEIDLYYTIESSPDILQMRKLK